MKLVIFAGGSGRRLWPLSRKQSPKQFEPLLGEKSTLQLAVERVQGRYGVENIFISTNERYLDIIREQLPQLPPENVIGEPTRRDLAPAVGLAMAHLARVSEQDEAVAILWGDNYMNQAQTFLELLGAAEQLLAAEETGIVFIGETARFANENLGWIGLGAQKAQIGGSPAYDLASFRYRPPAAEAQRMFDSGEYVWNSGYFVTTVGYIRARYRAYQPEMAAALDEIAGAIGRDNYRDVLHRLYPEMEAISFDDAILHHINLADAAVLHGEMGWSDPGTLYALKEALADEAGANVTEGRVLAPATVDSLLVNHEADKLMAVVGLDGIVVVNTPDALLVVHKDNIPAVKQLVDSLQGSELEKYS
ncbi:MAG: sugar phosphate nucleotidyltransferase [Candidatus Promineifilaceae bacterium]|nr:sugar phosphate nucleotidyltransferase [Candidatus Promineifilaceae bacterium]